jgi:hypothetical protein
MDVRVCVYFFNNKSHGISNISDSVHQLVASNNDKMSNIYLIGDLHGSYMVILVAIVLKTTLRHYSDFKLFITTNS